LLGRTVETLVPESMRAAHRHHRTDYLDQPSVRTMGVGPILAGRRKDGTDFPAYITLTPIMSGGDLLIVAVIREAE
jgi:PAS domain S-box-containing protein